MTAVTTPRAFVTDADRYCFTTDMEDEPAGLVFNPDATLAALLPLALARASRLQAHLDLWAGSDDEHVAPLAGVLAPLAAEIELVLRQMHDLVRGAV